MGTLCCCLGVEIKENFMHLDELWLIKYFYLPPCPPSHNLQGGDTRKLLHSLQKPVRSFMSTTCPKDATSPNFKKPTSTTRH